MVPSFASTIRSLAIVFASLALLGPALPAQTSQSIVPSRIVAPIDENARVTLHGYVHPLANAANDRGAAPDGMQLSACTSSSSAAPARKPPSASSSPTCTPPAAQLPQVAHARSVRPAVRTLRPGHRHRRILARHPRLRRRQRQSRQAGIEFSGNVAQLRDAFHTQIHKYAGQRRNSTTPTPTIRRFPPRLAPVIAGFVVAQQLPPEEPCSQPRQSQLQSENRHQATPQWTIGARHASAASTSFSRPATSPSSTISRTRSNPTTRAPLNGTGQTIAIINDSNINIDLVNQFRTLFGLPANPPQVIIDGNDPGVDGINNPDGPNYDSVEAYLDVEWSGAVAPNATIDLVIAADTALETGLFLAIEHAVYGNVAPVISLSFGDCEAGLGSTNAFLNSLWEQAAAQGKPSWSPPATAARPAATTTITQEYAVNGQAVNGFASTPYNVAVGGTDFYYSDYTPACRPQHAVRHLLEHHRHATVARRFAASTSSPSSPGTTASTASTSSITTTTLTAHHHRRRQRRRQQRRRLRGQATTPAAPAPARSPAIPSPHGKPEPAFPPTACATFPTSRSSPPTAPTTASIPSAPPTAIASPPRAAIRADLRRRRHLRLRARLRRHHGAGQPEIRPPGPGRHRSLPLKTQFPAAFHDVTDGHQLRALQCRHHRLPAPRPIASRSPIPSPSRSRPTAYGN